MNIRFSQKKHEIREDPVIEFFFKAKEFALKNVNILIGVAIVAVFAVGFYLIYSQMQSSGISKAEELFGQAVIQYNNRNVEKAVESLRIVADNHRSTPQGGMSALMLGGIFLSMGRNDESAKWFELAAAHGGEPAFVAGEAQEGLASCYEAKGDYSKAIECLEKALRDNQVTYRHNAMRWRMALLNQKIKNSGRAASLCREILSDTAATDYRQRAENLLAELEASSG